MRQLSFSPLLVGSHSEKGEKVFCVIFFLLSYNTKFDNRENDMRLLRKVDLF